MDITARVPSSEAHSKQFFNRPAAGAESTDTARTAWSNGVQLPSSRMSLDDSVLEPQC